MSIKSGLILHSGDKLILFYFKGNLGNKTYHVRGFIDGLIITRSWSRRHVNWRYEVVDPYWLQLNAENFTHRRTKNTIPPSMTVKFPYEFETETK